MSDNIFGCFVSGPAVRSDDSKKTMDLAADQGKLFRSYIWGEKGICPTLKTLVNKDYGSDLVLVLFEFYVSPWLSWRQSIKDIEYRKNEKSIGIPIIIDQDNFFDRNERERLAFLKRVLMQKMDILKEVVIQKKLATRIDNLISDLVKILEE